MSCLRLLFFAVCAALYEIILRCLAPVFLYEFNAAANFLSTHAGYYKFRAKNDLTKI